MRRLGHVSTLYPTLPIVELAEKLARIAPGKLKKCFFTTSGTEADETAVMMAQVSTGRTRRSSRSATGTRAARSSRSRSPRTRHGARSRRRSPAIKHAPAPYCYRCPLHLEYPKCGVALRAGHRGADPHDDDRPHRGHARRADPGRRRLHHAAEGVLRDRRRRSSASTAACSSATRCRPASAAPAEVVGHRAVRASSPTS